MSLSLISERRTRAECGRVANRAPWGGRDVREIDVGRRKERSLLALPVAVARADLSIIFDGSTDQGYPLVAVLDHDTGPMVSSAAIMGGGAG